MSTCDIYTPTYSHHETTSLLIAYSSYLSERFNCDNERNTLERNGTQSEEKLKLRVRAEALVALEYQA